MIALTQEHLAFIGGILGIVVFIWGIISGLDKKFEKNNARLEEMIDKKLDKIIEEKINKIESSFKSDLQEIKDSLKEINRHILGCNKRIDK